MSWYDYGELHEGSSYVGDVLDVEVDHEKRTGKLRLNRIDTRLELLLYADNAPPLELRIGSLLLGGVTLGKPDGFKVTDDLMDRDVPFAFSGRSGTKIMADQGER